jgi:hypothetical protein
LEKFEAIRFFGLASNFWQLTLNVAVELIDRGNPSSMSYEGWDWPSGEEYEEHTKWSDVNIIEPTLFNFYHGIELSLKSLILAKGCGLKSNHKLTSLLVEVKALYSSVGFISFYEKYIEQRNVPSIINDFCNESGMTMDLYYQSLKYPSSTKGVEFKHTSLKALGDDGVSLFQEISKDLRSARKDIEAQIAKECRDEIA